MSLGSSMGIDLAGTLLAIFFIFWIRFRKPMQQPPLLFVCSDLLPSELTWRNRVAKLSVILGRVILLLLFIALVNPQIPLPHLLLQRSTIYKPPPPAHGDALLLLIDVSGSMKEPYGTGTQSKMEVTREALTRLVRRIEERETPATSHLLGVMEFARASFVKCPLTYDETVIVNTLQALQPVTIDMLDGTSQGYAMFKAVEQILAVDEFTEKYQVHPAFDINDRAILMWTDGIEDPNPMDREDPFRSMRMLQGVKQAQLAGIRVYFVLCEPALDTSQYQNNQYQGQIDKISQAVTATGGRFYQASTAFSPDQIITDIFNHTTALVPAVKAIPPPTFSLRAIATLLAVLLLMLKSILDIGSPVLQ